MGISVQAYRIRIGNFNPTIRIKKTKEQVRSCIKDFKWNYLVIIVILVSFIPWPVAMPYCTTSQEGTRSIILKTPLSQYEQLGPGLVQVVRENTMHLLQRPCRPS